MRALNAMPATPTELLVRAAIVPATCVPCQLLASNAAGSPGPHSPALIQSPGSLASVSRPLPSFDDERVGDEVITLQDVGGEIGMRAIARVDHRDHHSGAGGLVPGRRRVDAAGGFEVVPLLVVARIVGRQRVTQDAVGLGVLDVRIAGGDVARQLLGFARATGGDPP